MQVVGFCFIIFFAILAGRAYFLQIFQAKHLAKRIQQQHESTVSLTPRRGAIVDRNGKELAVSIEVESLFARPHLIQNPDGAARALAPLLDMPFDLIRKKLTSSKHFVWIKRQLAGQTAEKIKALRIDGLRFVREAKRHYPNGTLAGQVLGFVGVDNKGLEGLEFRYNAELQGVSRTLIVNRDALGRLLFLEGIDRPEDQQGHNLMLTIDKNIQYIAEKELAESVSRTGAKGGIAIVMDPWTGEILALAVVPLFDPNRFSEYTPSEWRNRALTDVFEPGSTFKPFLVVSALQENLIKPHDIFFCENGAYPVADKIIHDAHPHGWLNVTAILKYSSNIGASKIGEHLGMNLFYQYIRKFGFGRETGISIPGEAPGFVPMPYRISEHTQSTLSFGQGISVTPLQLATAYCALANGGVLMEPHIMKKITDSKDGVVCRSKPACLQRIVSDRSAQAITRMLRHVVTEDGTGVKAAIDGYSVAGKTGTSQKTQCSQRGYAKKKMIASFAGYAPASRPRICTVVLIDEPKDVYYGGAVAAPVFRRIVRFALNYLHVAPDPQHSITTPWRETKNRDNGKKQHG